MNHASVLTIKTTMSEPVRKKKRTTCLTCNDETTIASSYCITSFNDWKCHRVIEVDKLSPSVHGFDWNGRGLLEPTEIHYVATGSWSNVELCHMEGYTIETKFRKIMCGLSDNHDSLAARVYGAVGVFWGKCLVCFPEKCWFCEKQHSTDLPVCCCCTALLMKLVKNIPRDLLIHVFTFLNWERHVPNRWSAQSLLKEYENRCL